MTLYLLLLSMVLIEVLYDGHFGDKHDNISNWILYLVFCLATTLGIINGTWTSALVYLCIRVALFDAMFGYLFRGSIFYLGKTSKTDMFWSMFPNCARVTIWVICFGLSIIIHNL